MNHPVENYLRANPALRALGLNKAILNHTCDRFYGFENTVDSVAESVVGSAWSLDVIERYLNGSAGIHLYWSSGDVSAKPKCCNRAIVFEKPNMELGETIKAKLARDAHHVLNVGRNMSAYMKPMVSVYRGPISKKFQSISEIKNAISVRHCGCVARLYSIDDIEAREVFQGRCVTSLVFIKVTTNRESVLGLCLSGGFSPSMLNERGVNTAIESRAQLIKHFTEDYIKVWREFGFEPVDEPASAILVNVSVDAMKIAIGELFPETFQRPLVFFCPRDTRPTAVKYAECAHGGD